MSSLIQNFVNIKKDEKWFSFFMFSYFFLFVVVFWILKPLKKTLFIKYYDQTGFQFWGYDMTAAQAEMLAKGLNMVIAVAAMLIFSLLSHYLKREKLTVFFSGLFVMTCLLFTRLVDTPSTFTVWGFYFFGDAFITVMLVCFFAFMADSVDSGRAKRLYGVVVLGGVCGGAVGSTFVRVTLKSISLAEAVAVCAGLCFLVGVAAVLARRNIPPSAIRPDHEAQDEQNKSILAGAKLVLASKYLLALYGVITIYEVLSQVVDFQFTQSVSHFLDGPAIGSHFATYYAIITWLGLFVQIFVTSAVMQKLGVGKALMALPGAILIFSVGFILMPILWVASLMGIADNALNYSINQSARESLYVVRSRQEKYLAKAFIDMFGVRFGKVLAIVAILLISRQFTEFDSIRWLSIFVAPLAAIWLVLVTYLGRRYRALAVESEVKSEE